MKNKYLLQTLMFVIFLSHLIGFSKEGIDPTSEKIIVKSNSFTSATDPGWSYTCDDGIEVELISLGLKNNVPASINISEVENVTRVVVEIVYKGKNPGSTIEIKDAAGNSYTANREVPVGGSSNVWYYRVDLPATASITYTNTINANYAQSMLAYVFRKKNDGTASSGVFTALSGYNDIQTTIIPIQTDSGPRTVTVELPISELTPDGRYIHIEVSASDGSFTELTETINSFATGQCCIKIFKLTLTDVAGSVNEVEIRIDSRNKKNGQNVNGQSWVMGGAVKTNVRCSCVETDTELPTADNFIDHILIEDISQLPEITFSDNCSNVTVEYSEFYSRQSCEIDFGPVNTDSNIWFNDFPFDKYHHWDKGYFLQFLDGSTKIYGKIVNNSEPDSGWNAQILFEGLVSYNTWVNSGGQVGSDAQKEQRSYANVDFNKPYKLEGFGNYKNSDISLVTTYNLNYMDIGPRDVYGDYGIGFWSSYEGTVNGQGLAGGSSQFIEMNASLKKCVFARDGANLLVREWVVTDAAGNSKVFIQRVEIELLSQF
jgi:hypothetical protein